MDLQTYYVSGALPSIENAMVNEDVPELLGERL